MRKNFIPQTFNVESGDTVPRYRYIPDKQRGNVLHFVPEQLMFGAIVVEYQRHKSKQAA